MLDEVIVLENLEKRIDEALHDATVHFGKRCPYCREPLFEGGFRTKIEIDHFIPVARGGQHVPWNLLPCCKTCNRKKRDKAPGDFLNQDQLALLSEYLMSVKKRHVGSLQRKLDAFAGIERIISDCSRSVADIDLGWCVDVINSISKQVLGTDVIHKVVKHEVDSACLHHILQMEVEVLVNGTFVKNSVEKWIRIAHLDSSLNADIDKALRSRGVGIVDDYISISNSHPELRRWMQSTPWKKNWSKSLLLMQKAIPKGARHFLVGSKKVVTRCVEIPFQFPSGP